jgi:hypothetical protein
MTEVLRGLYQAHHPVTEVWMPAVDAGPVQRIRHKNRGPRRAEPIPLVSVQGIRDLEF